MGKQGPNSYFYSQFKFPHAIITLILTFGVLLGCFGCHYEEKKVKNHEKPQFGLTRTQTTAHKTGHGWNFLEILVSLNS